MIYVYDEKMYGWLDRAFRQQATLVRQHSFVVRPQAVPKYLVEYD